MCVYVCVWRQDDRCDFHRPNSDPQPHDTIPDISLRIRPPPSPRLDHRAPLSMTTTGGGEERTEGQDGGTHGPHKSLRPRVAFFFAGVAGTRGRARVISFLPPPVRSHGWFSSKAYMGCCWVYCYLEEKNFKSGFVRSVDDDTSSCLAVVVVVLAVATTFWCCFGFLGITAVPRPRLLLLPLPIPTRQTEGVAVYFWVRRGAAALLLVAEVDVAASAAGSHMVFLARSTAPWPGALCFKGVSLAWGIRFGLFALLVFFLGGMVLVASRLVASRPSGGRGNRKQRLSKYVLYYCVVWRKWNFSHFILFLQTNLLKNLLRKILVFFIKKGRQNAANIGRPMEKRRPIPGTTTTTSCNETSASTTTRETIVTACSLPEPTSTYSRGREYEEAVMQHARLSSEKECTMP